MLFCVVGQKSVTADPLTPPSTDTKGGSWDPHKSLLKSMVEPKCQGNLTTRALEL